MLAHSEAAASAAAAKKQHDHYHAAASASAASFITVHTLNPLLSFALLYARKGILVTGGANQKNIDVSEAFEYNII